MSSPTIARQRWIAPALQQASAVALRLRGECTDVHDLAGRLYRTWYNASRTEYDPVPDTAGSGTPAGFSDLLTTPPPVGAVDRMDRDTTGQPCWLRSSTAWPSSADTAGTAVTGGAGSVARVSWHVTASSLPALVDTITSALAATDIDWQIRAGLHPAVSTRADACVLFVPTAALAEMADRIEMVADSFASTAISAGPPTTLPVRPGCAAAIEPGGGENYGLNRCRLIAEAVYDVDWTIAAALNAIANRFDAAGVDPSAPWQPARGPALPWSR
jgi:hypothetical protein